MDNQIETAMQLYRKGQAKETAGLLQEILKQAPEFQYARLYLGVCQLAVGENALAEAELRRVVSSGGSYRDEARFFLAKALFIQGNLEDGSKELRTLAATDGPAASAARRMLPFLDKVK
jgi:predicted Zn-dependent protease